MLLRPALTEAKGLGVHETIVRHMVVRIVRVLRAAETATATVRATTSVGTRLAGNVLEFCRLGAVLEATFVGRA